MKVDGGRKGGRTIKGKRKEDEGRWREEERKED